MNKIKKSGLTANNWKAVQRLINSANNIQQEVILESLQTRLAK